MALRDSMSWNWIDQTTGHQMFDLGQGIVVNSETLAWRQQNAMQQMLDIDSTGRFSFADALRAHMTGGLLKDRWPDLYHFAVNRYLDMNRVGVFATDAGVAARRLEQRVEETIVETC